MFMIFLQKLSAKHIMLDKALETITNTDSFYFQLYPLSLYIVNPHCDLPAPGTTYRLTLLKGQQKFDETKLPIEATFREVQGRNVMVMPRCPLNFYVPSFNKNKDVEFVVNMYQTENSEEYFIAEHSIPIADYVNDYKKTRNVRFEHTVKFSQDYELQFELYVQKSRIALEKVVKEYKNERSLKSPLRERPPEPSAPANKRTFTKGSSTQQAEKEQLESNTELSSSKNKKIQSRANSQIKAELGKDVKTEKPTDRTQNQGQSQAPFEKPSSVRQATEKRVNREPSQPSSKAYVPEVAIHYRAVSKKEGEIQMSNSQRLSPSGSVIKVEQHLPVSHEGGTKEKAVMAVFLLLSIALMIWTMHPTRKV